MKTKNHYDFIVYGATLEGLLSAYYLHQKNLKVLVLEPSDKIGGFFSSVDHNSITIPSLFTSIPHDDTSVRLADWIKNNSQNLPVGENFSITKKDAPPVTFEKGHFEPFVGFGENAPKESDFLQNFTASQRIEFSPTVNEWIKNILSSGLEIRFGSMLTAMSFSDKKVSVLTINDKDTLSAENYIFAQNPSDLVEYLDPSVVSQKVLARLSKGDFWSILQLSLAHSKPVTEKEEIHVLYGTQKNPIVSVGAFTKDLTSQWISFISPDVIDINEEGVQILKEMKRQLKRAYPEALTDISFDKIALWPKTHGYIDLKSKQFGQLEGVENICICSGHLVEHTNPFIAALTAAQYTTDLLSQLISSQVEAEATQVNPEAILNA